MVRLSIELTSENQFRSSMLDPNFSGVRAIAPAFPAFVYNDAVAQI